MTVGFLKRWRSALRGTDESAIPSTDRRGAAPARLLPIIAMRVRLDPASFPRWPHGCWPTDRQRLLIAACLLTDEPAARRAWDAWHADGSLIGSDAASNHLLPLMLARLETWGAFEAERRQIVGLVRYYWLFQQLLKRGLDSALGALDAAGIDVLLLKGAAIATSTYRDGHRPMNDLDLLVRRDQADAAIAALTAAGWTPRFPDPGRFIPVVHACCFGHPSGIELDLHVSPFHERPLAVREFLAIATAGERVVVGSRPALVPCPADQFLFICAHGMRYADVAPFRWLVDACLLLRRHADHFDWDRLRSRTALHRLVLPVAATIRYLADELQTPVPPDVLRWVASSTTSVLERIEFASVTLPPRATHVLWHNLLPKTILHRRLRGMGVRMPWHAVVPLVAFLGPPYAPHWAAALRSAAHDLRDGLAELLRATIRGSRRQTVTLGSMAADRLEGFHMPEQWTGGQLFRWSSPKAVVAIDCPAADYDAELTLLPARPWHGDLEHSLRLDLNGHALRVHGCEDSRIHARIECHMIGPQAMQRLTIHCAAWQAAIGDRRRLGVPLATIQLTRRVA